MPLASKSLEALLGELGVCAMRLGSSSKSKSSRRQEGEVSEGETGDEELEVGEVVCVGISLEGLTGPFQVRVKGER
jgi:hypothetical protein